jgi:hypothetical protein
MLGATSACATKAAAIARAPSAWPIVFTVVFIVNFIRSGSYSKRAAKSCQK